SFAGSGNQDDLASDVAALTTPVDVGKLGERQPFADVEGEPSAVDELHQLVEVLRLVLRDEHDGRHLGAWRSVDLARDGHHHPTRTNKTGEAPSGLWWQRN